MEPLSNKNKYSLIQKYKLFRNNLDKMIYNMENHQGK